MSYLRGLGVLFALFCAVMAAPASAQLSEVTGFGSNPGGLKMFKYVPPGLRQGAALVVMMHGCAQTPQDVDVESGWIQMADTYRFAMVFPQTTFTDPAGTYPCFRSYDRNHNRRGVGETLSVKQMTDWMRRNHGVARERIYVTGFSSGAIHTGVMLASYPDVFAAGAIVSAHPYGCATSYNEYVLCNVLGGSKSPAEWGTLARSAYPGYRGSYPKVSLWHGTSDLVIRESNSWELIEQWTNVHGIDQTADDYSVLNGYPHVVYKTPAGEPRVEHYRLIIHGHAIPVNTLGLYQPVCGSTGGLATQSSSICAAYYIAKWFGLAG